MTEAEVKLLANSKQNGTTYHLHADGYKVYFWMDNKRNDWFMNLSFTDSRKIRYYKFEEAQSILNNLNRHIHDDYVEIDTIITYEAEGTK